jgi:tungstate transport system substrate-binding protein
MTGDAMGRILLAVWLAVAAAVLPGAVPAVAQQTQTIRLATTTSLDNSGLLKAILPQFTKATGVTVHVLALGTGQALDAARRGDADLVLVHDPEAEQKFIDEGHGVNRRQVAWNDFILVGPGADPAKIKGGSDAVAAFRAIAKARAPFISRGDRSGTHELELRLWKTAALDPKSGAGSWYREIGGGMGQALNAAAATPAYTLADRGTWLGFKNRGPLGIVVEGDSRLVNRYNVIELNPKTHPGARLAAARRLAGWLVGPEGRAAIDEYRVDGQRLFYLPVAIGATGMPRKSAGLTSLPSLGSASSRLPGSVSSAGRGSRHARAASPGRAGRSSTPSASYPRSTGPARSVR